MKILFIVTTFPALSQTFILNQIIGLIERGCTVDILASIKGTEKKVHTDVIKYRLLKNTYYYNDVLITVPKKKIKRLTIFIKLLKKNFTKRPKKLIKSLNFFKYGKEALCLKIFFMVNSFIDKGPYDIIHCHFGPNGKIGLYLNETGAIKGKIITSFHGYDTGVYPKIFGQNVYKELFQRTNLITVNSEFTRQQVLSLGCPERIVKRHPMGLDLFKFKFRDKCLKKNEKIKILTVSRLVEKKGLEYSIEAIAKIIKIFPNVKYSIAGGGPLKGKLRKKIKSLNVKKWIKLIGYKNNEEIQKLFYDSHIFILSSIVSDDGDQEGQGLVLQEAQLCGLPVVCTNHNGFPESIRHGISGFLVPEKDVDAMVDRLKFLIENPEKWSEMGRAGREYVIENYDINKLNDTLFNIYENLIKNK